MTWIVLGVTLVLIVPFAIGAWSMAPWVPSWKKDLPRIMTLANLQPGETFYDLGCGNGKVVLAAAEQPGVQAIGVELAWPLFLICIIRKWLAHNPRLHFVLGNLFTQDLSQADVVYVFGVPETLQKKLKMLFEQKLKPGARVISYTFKIAGWTPTLVHKPTSKDIAIYFYQR